MMEKPAVCTTLRLLLPPLLLTIATQLVHCDYASDCLAESAPNECFHGTKCYMQRTTARTYHDSDSKCLTGASSAMAPGTLMKANDINVINAVFDAMGLTGSGDYHLGGRQRGTFTEPDGGWTWYNNKTQPYEPFDGNEQWAPGQPDDAGGAHCVWLTANERLLYDGVCGNLRKAICEHDMCLLDWSLQTPIDGYRYCDETDRTCNYELRLDTAGALSTKWGADIEMPNDGRGYYGCMKHCSLTQMCQAFTFLSSNNTCRMHWPPHGHGCEKFETSVGSMYGFHLAS